MIIKAENTETIIRNMRAEGHTSRADYFEALLTYVSEVTSAVADVLQTAERQGADKDEPEGSRYIQLSDTLASQMAESLQLLGE